MLRNFIKNIVNSLSCAETHHFSDAEAPLSSILDTEDAVCHGQMPSRIRIATLEGLPDEIRCHILGFLSYNEIIRCALTCLTLYNTVKYSVELQYIIELGAQRLIEVHPRSPTASLAEYLCILRKKAKAWNAFKPIVTDVFRGTTLFDVNSIVHGNIISCMPSVYVIPQAVSHIMRNNTTHAVTALTNLRSVLHTYRYMDELQDLEIIIEFPIDVDSEGFKYRISSCTISTGEEHPLSHGSRVVSGRAACSEAQCITIAVAILDDRLAVYIAGLDENPYWSLHVLSWQRPSQADDLCAVGDGNGWSDIRFLVKEKLIALSTHGHIHLYDTKDPSRAPRLHASFMLPSYGKGIFDHPSIFHSAASCTNLAVPVDRWIWTTNPADRVISVTSAFSSTIYIISARIFFMDIPSTWFGPTSEDGRSVTWSSWGPQNSRLLPKERLGFFCGVGGSRVIWASRIAGRTDSLLRLHMADFNPSAVARGIGKVIREPTISVPLWSDMKVTTCLPFLEVSHDITFDGPLWDIKLDEETMVVFTRPEIESEWKMQANVFEM